MRKFLAAAVFLMALIAFIVNQLGVFTHSWQTWCGNYLDDLVFFPIVLTTATGLHRLLFIRPMSISPLKMMSVVIFVSIVSEWIIPLITTTSTGDVFDVPAFAAGAIIYYYCIYPASTKDFTPGHNDSYEDCSSA